MSIRSDCIGCRPAVCDGVIGPRGDWNGPRSRLGINWSLHVHIGFGFYRHMLNDDYFRFAVQCGATHAVVHLCDYGLNESGGRKDDQPVGEEMGWGIASRKDAWSVEEIRGIKEQLRTHGLQLHAIENFDPGQWHDVLLDGPKRAEQIEVVKRQIRNVGEAGVPVFAYGAFVTQIIDFVIMALCVFLMVKVMNRVTAMLNQGPPSDPKTKDCPHCCMSIPAKATRCGHCTAQLETKPA